MSIRDFCIDLRADLIEILSGVRNANPYLFFDNTKSNWQIKRDLELTLSSKLDEAKKFGIEIFYRYISCSNKRHRDYVYIDCNGKRFFENDMKLRYEHISTFDYERKVIACPCSRNNKSEINDRQVLIGFKLGEFSQEKSDVVDVLTYISSAVDCSGDKKPRSGIREQLLLAILVLNDCISPEKMSDMVIRLRGR